MTIILVVTIIVVVGLLGFGCCLAFDLWQYAKLGTRRPDDGRRE